MRTKDIVTGLIVLAIIVAGVFWFRRSRQEKQNVLTLPTPNAQEQIKKTFNGLTIPENTEKTDLKDVSGGNGVGIATRDMVLADLPEPKTGTYYKVWVDGKLLGTMRVAKGGFLFEGKVEGKKVQVKLGEKLILEGSF